MSLQPGCSISSRADPEVRAMSAVKRVMIQTSLVGGSILEDLKWRRGPLSR